MRILFVGVFDTSRSSHHPMLREFRNAGNDVDVFS